MSLVCSGMDRKDRAGGRRASAALRRETVRRLSAILLLFLLGWCLADPLSAEEPGPLQTAPPLSAAFPLAQQGSEVHLIYPVALNEQTVVRPNARLHFLYVRPESARTSGGTRQPGRVRPRAGMPLGGMGVAGMGLGGMRMGATAGGPPGSSRTGHQNGGARRHPIDRTTVWTSTNAFREALSRIDGSDLRLVFSLPAPIVRDPEPVEEGEEVLDAEPRPQPRRVRDEPLALPLGLLLAQRKGAPTVLAVEEGSAGERAGLVAKDRIVSLDGRPSPKSLAAFLALYRQEKARGLSTLTVVVERAGNLAPLSLAVPLPPRLEGSILDTPGE